MYNSRLRHYLLSRVLDMLDELDMDDRDTKGDL